MKSFVLASASPRRREILKKAGYNFVIAPSCVEEIRSDDLPAEDIAVKNATIKAEDVFGRYKRVTVGADTVVVLDGVILGKPSDKAENAEFLRKLSGREHVVITGYCVIGEDGSRETGYDEAVVRFNELDEKRIEEYVESGNGADKAGGYGIQDGYGLVKSVKGNIDTVIGLPADRIKEILERCL